MSRKKIVCVSGSPRKGNSEYFVKALEERLIDAEYDTKTVFLSESIFQFCDGCLQCDETGVCHIDDGMNEIIDLIRQSSLLIFVTPARWALLSAPLKNFIDRLNPMAANEELCGKNMIIVGIGQTKGEDAQGIYKAVKSVKNFADDAGIETIKTVVIEGLLNSNDLQKSNSVQKYLDMVIDSIG